MERLKESSEEADVRRRHALHYLEFAESLQPVREERLGILESEHDNLRAWRLAFVGDTGMAEVQLRICSAVWRLWFVRGLLSEGSAHIEAALRAESGDHRGALGPALRAAAVLAWAQGEHDEAERFARASLDTHRALGDEVGMTSALVSLGLALQSLGQLAEAKVVHEQSRVLAQKLGLAHALGAALANLGDVATLEGDDEGARDLYRDSLAVCRGNGDVEGAAAALLYLGVVMLKRDDDSEVLTTLAEGLEMFTSLGFTERMGACLTGLGAGIVSHDADRAAQLLGAAHALRQGITSHLERWEEELLTAVTTAAAEQLGDAGFTAAYERGRAMPHETAEDCLAAMRARE